MTQANQAQQSGTGGPAGRDTNALTRLENLAAWHLDRAGLTGISQEEHRYHRQEVEALGRELSTHASTRPQALKLLGRNALEAGQWSQAESHMRAALKLAPQDPGLHFNLGHLALLRQKLSDAAGHFRQAIELDPDATAADQSLAYVRFRSGLYAEAFGDYRRLIRKYPHQWLLKTRLLECAERIKADYDNPALSDDVIELLQTPYLDHQKLAPLAGSLLVHRYRLDDPHSRVDLNALIQDPLLRHTLPRLLFVSPEVDDLLATLRQTILHHHLSTACFDPDLEGLFTGLLWYGLHSEYILPQTPDEDTTVDSLTTYCQDLCAEADWNNLALPAMLLALYSPLHQTLRRVDLNQLSHALPDAYRELLDQHYLDTQAEQDRARQIPTLTPVTQGVSAAVQSQYEEHPYPRWTYLPRYAPSVYHDAVAAEIPRYTPPATPLKGPIQTLVAGTGTGRHAIHLARHFYDMQVTAVDLSRRSLAYGEARAEALGLDNIAFYQADILYLGDDAVHDQHYDVIECSGVLHHMADPLAGWQQLCQRLKPGGLMKVGLYSTRARAVIKRLRAVIADQGLAPNDADIRRFRHSLLQQSADTRQTDLAPLIQSVDFYSMSGVRDLLFHVQEHTFTPKELADMIESLPLDFLGFVLPANARRSYQHFFPDDPMLNDLDNWERLEQDNPNLFTGMYQLYLQKPGT